MASAAAGAVVATRADGRAATGGSGGGAGAAACDGGDGIGLEIVVRGQSLCQAATLHDYEGKTVGQAPVLVEPFAIKLDCRAQFGLERDHLDAGIRTDSHIALCGNSSGAYI